MALFDDMVQFLDGGSPIPYYGEYKYVPKPIHIDELVEYQFKRYYKSSHRYFVGIPSNNWVREIHAKDYKLVKSLSMKEVTVKKVAQKIQLCMDFS